MRDSRQAPGARGELPGAVTPLWNSRPGSPRTGRALKTRGTRRSASLLGTSPASTRRPCAGGGGQAPGGRAETTEPRTSGRPPGVDARSGLGPTRKPARTGSAQPMLSAPRMPRIGGKLGMGDGGDASPAAAEEAARRGAIGTRAVGRRGLWDPMSPRRIPSSTATMELRAVTPEAAADILAERARRRIRTVFRAVQGNRRRGAGRGRRMASGRRGSRSFLTSFVDTASATRDQRQAPRGPEAVL